MPRRPQESEPEWAQRLRAPLDALGPWYSGRLSRARTYARNGSVLRLTAQPGMVTARVQGSEWSPYIVKIAVPLLPERVWDAATEALATQPGALALVLTGTLSAEVESVFVAAGAPLVEPMDLPTTASCTCPDYEVPCKHALAVYLALIDRLRQEPALLFTLRGRPLEQVLAAIGNRWSAEARGEGASVIYDEGTAYQAGDSDAPTFPLAVGHFYEVGPGLAAVDVHTDAPTTDGAILRLLGQPPFAAPSEDVIAALLPAYEIISRQALRLISRSGEARRAPRRRSSGSSGS